MKTYQFSLKYRLTDQGTDMDALAEQLAKAGCTDAVIGIGTLGRVALDFSRSSESAEDAVYSALTQAKAALPMTELIEASPDLMDADELAEVVGLGGENLRQLMITKLEFPKPVHEGASVTLYHLSEVLEYLAAANIAAVDEALLELTIMTQGVNMAKELMRVEKVEPKLKPLVV